MAVPPVDYSTLIGPKTTAGSIAGWANDASLQAQAAIILYEAETMIFRRLRVREMLVDGVAGTLTIAQDYLAMPADFLDPYWLSVTGTNPSACSPAEIVMKPRQEVIGAYQWDQSGNRVQSQPQWFYIDFNSSPARAKFDFPPDLTYPYLLNYYQQPAHLAAGNLTNFLTNNYPKLLRLACMIEAAEWQKILGIGGPALNAITYQQAFEVEVQKVQAESDRSMRAAAGNAAVMFV